MISQSDHSDAEQPRPERLSSFLNGNAAGPELRFPNSRPAIGVLEGCGIGPQVIGAALQVLSAVEEAADLKFEILRGGPIGEEAEAMLGRPLPEPVADFCTQVFDRRGAILSGPGGGRYVYDLRKRFDLFCKFVPVRPWPELANAGRMSPQHLRNVDVLIIRDNRGGVYQGHWRERASVNGRIAEHSFSYCESEVRQLIGVAARVAASRDGRLHVILKEGGIPTVSSLWREVGRSVARESDIDVLFMNVDLAAYELIQQPSRFDVVVAPNLFGDILADVAGVLVGSRGNTFSGNFNGEGAAVYQTNHGCAQDLAGTDIANPAGQILSLSMLLRESFGLDDAAGLIEQALAAVWRQGWRTRDLAESGCPVIGTRELADRVSEQVLLLAERKSLHETRAAAD